MKYIKSLSIILLLFFSVLMIQITLPYLAFRDDVAFLRIKSSVIDNQIWKAAFYLHVFSSLLCLIAGFTQFSKRVLVSFPQVHRIFGRLYIVVIILISGPAGLIMAFHANGGIISQTAFILLSALWIAFTLNAYLSIKKGLIQSHKEFMIRSFALTLSAITLRGWKWLIVLIFRPHPMDAYMLVAWLGWVPNLLIAEWLIWSMKSNLPFWKKRTPSY